MAASVVSNWRSAHAIPLNTIYMDMKTKANRIDSTALAVQRLKRQRSLISKLAREPTMRLSQMQDIGGCRTVLKDKKDVEQLVLAYRKSRAEHEFVKTDDYVTTPQQSGYRSIHLIYRYQSKTRPEYNGLLFEVQIRTELQHAWATAVETVGAVMGQSLKSNEGERAWLDFFRYASAAFAMSERTSPIPNVGRNRRQIATNLRAYMKSLDVAATLEKYGEALRATESTRVRDAGYFLLVLRPEAPELEIYAYKKGQFGAAYADYLQFEESLPRSNVNPQLRLFPEFSDYSGAQAVLVGAQSFKSLRQSYPNYYLDSRKFVAEVESYVDRTRF